MQGRNFLPSHSVFKQKLIPFRVKWMPFVNKREEGVDIGSEYKKNTLATLVWIFKAKSQLDISSNKHVWTIQVISTVECPHICSRKCTFLRCFYWQMYCQPKSRCSLSNVCKSNVDITPLVFKQEIISITLAQWMVGNGKKLIFINQTLKYLHTCFCTKWLGFLSALLDLLEKS